jgi:hypothetical protein
VKHKFLLLGLNHESFSGGVVEHNREVEDQ